jgi:HSP20 family molecular chaperone IbpA
MDETTKKFFNELSQGETPAEPVELVKTSSSPTKEKTRLEEESWGESEGQLTIDVYQTPDEIVIESPIAGVSVDDLDISITNESVSIRGRRERERRVKDEDYFYQECYWGKFSRSIILPQEIDSERSEAAIKNGVLTIHLPKIMKAKSRKIKVRLD